jgi:hypothetical protein
MESFTEVKKWQILAIGYSCANNECLVFRHVTTIISKDVQQHVMKRAL